MDTESLGGRAVEVDAPLACTDTVTDRQSEDGDEETRGYIGGGAKALEHTEPSDSEGPSQVAVERMAVQEAPIKRGRVERSSDDDIPEPKRASSRIRHRQTRPSEGEVAAAPTREFRLPIVPPGGEEAAEPESSAEAVKRCANALLAEIAKSSNLNGVVRGRMKANCKELLGFADSVNEPEVIRSLRADNNRMREQLKLLQTEMKALRKAFSERNRPAETDRPAETSGTTEASIRTASTTEVSLRESLIELKEELKRDLIISLGDIINVRLEDIQRRLPAEPILRPPLAADRRRQQAEEQPTGTPQPPGTEPVASQALAPSPGVSGTSTGKKKGKKKSKKRQAPPPPVALAPPVGPARVEPTTSASTSAPNGTWRDVANRGGKAKKAAHVAPSQAKRKLVAPTSAAVVVTLKPEADTDYLTVMGRATTLKLDAFGISHVKVRKTATGARIIEVPGTQSGPVADNLADKLRELIGDVADVTRPVKKAEVRISGFDESVTPDQVKGEMASKGKCPEAQIEVGKVRWVNGSGAVIARCPTTVAKVLAEAGRLILGWSSARVEAMESRPMRCYRCMGVGHTSAMCPSAVDRSTCCFRCSKPGHKAKECSAPTPWCAVCHQAKKPAGHVMRGPSCAPPSVRGKEVSARATETSTNTAEEQMQH